MGFGKGCEMSVLLIRAHFYFSYKIAEKYRLQGTCGGHLFHSVLLQFHYCENTSDFCCEIEHVFLIKLVTIVSS